MNNSNLGKSGLTGIVSSFLLALSCGNLVGGNPETGKPPTLVNNHLADMSPTFTSGVNYDNQTLGIKSSAGWLSTSGKFSFKRENAHMFVEYRAARNIPMRREIDTGWINDLFFKNFYKYWTNHQNAIYWLIFQVLIDTNTYKLGGWAIRDSSQEILTLDWKNNLLTVGDVGDKKIDARLRIKTKGKWKEYSVLLSGVSYDEFDALTYLYKYSPSPLWPPYISLEFFNWGKSKVRKEGGNLPPEDYLSISPLRDTIQLKYWEFVDKDYYSSPSKKWYQQTYVQYPLIGISVIFVLGILAQVGKLVLARRKRS